MEHFNYGAGLVAMTIFATIAVGLAWANHVGHKKDH